jgi:hypothetical protein
MYYFREPTAIFARRRSCDCCPLFPSVQTMHVVFDIRCALQLAPNANNSPVPLIAPKMQPQSLQRLPPTNCARPARLSGAFTPMILLRAPRQ